MFFAVPITPLLWHTVCFLSGIMLYEIINIYIPLLFVIIIFFLILSAFYPYSYLKKITYCFIFFVLGHGTFHKQMHHYNLLHHSMYHDCVNLTLKIIDIDTKKHPYLRNVYTCQLDEICVQQSGIRYHTDHKIMIYSLKKPPLEIGQTIKLFNIVLQKPPDGSFASYCKKEHILANYMCNEISYGLCSTTPTIAHYFNAWRSTLWHRAKRLLNPLAYQCYSLIFLGKKVSSGVTMKRVKDNCKSWGISHQLARSGLHLVAFVIVWETVFYYLPIAWWLKQWVIILITLCYYVLSWPSISFIRSCLVFIAYKTAQLFRQQSLSIHIMSCITFLVLFINPHCLFFLDFQLSFGITFLLAWINHIQTLRNRAMLKTI